MKDIPSTTGRLVNGLNVHLRARIPYSIARDSWHHNYVGCQMDTQPFTRYWMIYIEWCSTLEHDRLLEMRPSIDGRFHRPLSSHYSDEESAWLV